MLTPEPVEKPAINKDMEAEAKPKPTVVVKPTVRKPTAPAGLVAAPAIMNTEPKPTVTVHPRSVPKFAEKTKAEPVKLEKASPAPSLTPTEPESPLAAARSDGGDEAEPASSSTPGPDRSRSFSLDSSGDSAGRMACLTPSPTKPSPKTHKFDKYYYQSLDDYLRNHIAFPRSLKRGQGFRYKAQLAGFGCGFIWIGQVCVLSLGRFQSDLKAS